MHPAAACLAAFALFLPTKEPAKAPTELRGTWRLIAIESEGKPNDLAEPSPRVVVRGNKLHYGGAEVAEIIADAGASPKVIDLRFSTPKRVLEGIYSIDGDTWKVCLNKQTEGARERPDGFETKGHESWRTLIFKHDTGDPMEGLRGFVGLQLSFNRERKEVSVTATIEGSPAGKAGFMKDDIVVNVGGIEASDLPTAVNAVRQAKPGSKLVFHIRRGKEERDVTVTVALLPFTVVADLD